MTSGRPRLHPRPLLALLLTVLAAAFAVGSPAAADARAARAPHGKATSKRTVATGFTHRRSHGRRGLAPRRRAGVPGQRPVAPTKPYGPVAGLSAPAPAALPPPVTPTADPLGALPAPVPASPELPALVGPDPVPPATSVLGVQTLDTPDYRLLLSRPSVTAGPVRLQLRNGGEDAHNLLLTPTDGAGDAIPVALTQPGATRTSTVSLAPGRYRLICTLTAPVVHESAGMRATLDVTAAP